MNESTFENAKVGDRVWFSISWLILFSHREA